jgi:hypothetical protein
MLILRDGIQQEMTVVIGERDKPRWYSHRHYDYDFDDFVDSRRPGIGVSLQSLSGDLGEYFGVPDNEGALVIEVFDRSPAEMAGLKAGDVIVDVDDERVDDPSDVAYLIEDFDVGDTVMIGLVRDRIRRSFAVEVQEVEDPHYSSLKSLKAFQLPYFFEQFQSVPYHRNWLRGGELFDSDELERQMKQLERQLRRLESDLEEIEERLD